MTKHLKAAVLCFGLAMPLLSGPVGAEQKKQAHSAATPAPILTAKKISIANGGGDESRYEAVTYGGGPDRAYNEFYAVMKSWGRYELVDAPGDADLVFEISLTVFQLQRLRVMSDDSPEFDSRLRLVIRDTKTHETLWGLTEHAPGALLQDNRDKNFEHALTMIVAEVRRIAGPVAAAAAKN